MEDETTPVEEHEVWVDVPDAPDEQSPEPEPESGQIIVPQKVLDIINAAPSGLAILTTAIDAAVFLAQKNAAYGDSALNPVRIFSKADPVEQIKVRIDDKLSRLIRGNDYPGDDDYRDLLGYLILYFIAEVRQRNE